MKINIVFGHSIPFPPIKGGGIERIDHSLAKALIKAGHQVIAYSRKNSSLPNKNIDEYGIEHIRIAGYDYNNSKILNAINSLRWCIKLIFKVKEADVTIFNSLFAFIMSKQKKLGVIANSVQRTPDWKLFPYKLFDRNYCTCFSVLKQAEALPFKLNNLCVLYNCVEVATKKDFSKSSRTGLHFLFFGRMIADKGILYLIKGFEKSLQNYHENKLFIIGPSKSEEGADEVFYSELFELVKTSGLAKKIIFSGPIYQKDQLQDKILDCDAVCFPSTGGEGFPSAVLEAMTLGIPALVSDFGPMTEAVEHKKSGYITKVANPDSIAEGIVFFTENKHQLKAMGEYARTCVEKNFSAEVIAKVLISDVADFKSKKRK